MNESRSAQEKRDTFSVGDKVRVASSWLAKAGDIYTVEAVSDTHIRASNGSTVLSYRREKFVHA